MATIETITVGENSFNTATGVPIGTIISLMGTQAPAQYLACEGQTVDIATFPDLADYFEAQFGTKNHFGGDGTATFAVPDLRGEFLRGTGTNSHTNQGDGADVGAHQDATEINQGWFNESFGGFSWSPNASSSYLYLFKNGDKTIDYGLRKSITTSAELRRKDDTYNANVYYQSVRPTNISVLYCIKAFN